MKLLKVKEQPKLVPSSQYPHAAFTFQHFNAAQSRAIEHYDKDVNYIAAIPTGSGKTILGEIFLAHEIRGRGNKGMYLVPLKALAQEKIDDWTSPHHHFANAKVAICTGDYRLTEQRKKEIQDSDLIIMSMEMLNSRSRNYRSEQNDFLKSVQTLVIDESHSIGMKDRGPHLESGLMKFTEINPSARIVMLSATLPNVDDVGKWLSRLNGKPTIVLESHNRPCPLHIHYVKYNDVSYSYDENERAKITAAINIVERHASDKFLLFVHTKRTGEMLTARLKEIGIRCEYHNADLAKEKRVAIERAFREDPKLRCIVATSGLAQGLNMPARRVVVLGVHRALTEVEPHEIFQAAGRAGRPQYDPQGDAYVLLPARGFEKQKARLEEPRPIESQIGQGKCLAFHLTSEVHHRNIQSLDDVHNWYERSFAYHQTRELDDEVVTEVMKGLTRCGAMIEQDGTYETTSIGTVASMFYYSPYDVADLARNWSRVFDCRKENNDLWISMALGNTDSLRGNIASISEKEEMNKYRYLLDETKCEKTLSGSRPFTDGALKAGCCYYNLLKGANSAALAATMRNLKMDFERLSEVLCAIDQMTGKWNQREYFRRLYLRILYGVEEEVVSLCCLRGVGKIKAKRLWDANLRSLEDIAKNTLGVIKALNCSKPIAEGIVKNAKDLLREIS